MFVGNRSINIPTAIGMHVARSMPEATMLTMTPYMFVVNVSTKLRTAQPRMYVTGIHNYTHYLVLFIQSTIDIQQQEFKLLAGKV